VRSCTASVASITSVASVASAVIALTCFVLHPYPYLDPKNRIGLIAISLL